MRCLILFAITLFVISGCEQIALKSTPAKKPISSHSALAKTAEDQFWGTLHNGDYANLDHATYLLTAAYLENPNDPDLAAYLGFAHIWKITEREREKNISPLITDEIILARKYFSDASELNPNDARLQGFLGVSLLASGDIFHDEREEVRGYFQLQRAIHLWPEFNYFTAGYPMSNLDAQSKHFNEGLAWQWQTLSLCAGTTITKDNPDFSPYMSQATQTGPQRACWNSWIAPHNFEGFFLNMGDMLVKQGDWQTAIKIYQNAKLSPSFSTWPYKNLLENRIHNAEKNVNYFEKSNGRTADTRILFNSGYGCSACHQSH